MPCSEKSPPPRLSLLLSQVFPQSPAESVLTRLADSEEYLRLLPRRPTAEIELDDTEQAILQDFRLPKRRAQWLTGRLCAKRAVVGYCRRYLPHLPEPAENHIHIRNTSTGRPELNDRQLPPELHGLDISISHSGDYAIALVSSGLCGVDIQHRSDTLIRVRDRFCLREEEIVLQRHLAALDGLWQLALLWAAKEAAKKALSSQGMMGFLQFLLIDIEVIDNAGCIFLFRQDRQAPLPLGALRIAVTQFDDYALAICLPEENLHA